MALSSTIRNGASLTIAALVVVIAGGWQITALAEINWRQDDVFIVEESGDHFQWRYSTGGISDLEELNFGYLPVDQLAFGDFDGNEQTDVFWVQKIGDRFQWRYSSGGLSQWQNLNYSNVPLSKLRFGDFDGDRKTDVFSVVRVNSRKIQWRYSSAGIKSWKNLNYDVLPLSEFRFGDFNGDNKTDVFSVALMGRGRYRWRYSAGGIGDWQELNYAKVPLRQLRFGKFDDDDITDVFAVLELAHGDDTKKQWAYSSGGTSQWRYLNGGDAPLDDLQFADLDGDGKTDIFRIIEFGGRWYWEYSSGGSEPLRAFKITKAQPSTIRFGQFDIPPRIEYSFVNTLGPVFMHPRCMRCHTFEAPDGVSSEDPHDHTPRSCGSCHLEEQTGVTVWITPRDARPATFVDWTGKDVVTICELVKADIPRVVDLRHHLLMDPPIRWAIENRITPNGVIQEATPVTSMAEFETLVNRWLEAGELACE